MLLLIAPLIPQDAGAQGPRRAVRARTAGLAAALLCSCCLVAQGVHGQKPPDAGQEPPDADPAAGVHGPGDADAPKELDQQSGSGDRDPSTRDGAGGAAPSPALRLGPLLRQRVARLEERADSAAGPPTETTEATETDVRHGESRPSGRPPVAAGAMTGVAPVSIHLDTRERVEEIEAFLAERGGVAGTSFTGAPDDLFGGALTATVPVSLLLELAGQPGVRYVRERIPPRMHRGPPDRKREVRSLLDESLRAQVQDNRGW